MKNKPFLSICIPTHERVESLEIFLNSLIEEVKQYPHLVEICVSDNGSKDGTYELLKKYAKKYSFLRIRRNETNIGYDNNLIAVLEMAHGEYCWTTNDHIGCYAHGGMNDLINTLKKHKPIMCLLTKASFDKWYVHRAELFFQKEIYNNLEFIDAYANYVKAITTDDPITGYVSAYIFKKTALKNVLSEIKKTKKPMYAWSHLIFFLRIISTYKGKILVYKKKLLENPISPKKYKVFFPSEIIEVFMINRIKALDALPINKRIREAFLIYKKRNFPLAYIKALIKLIVIKDLLDKELKNRKETEKVLALGKYDFTLLESVVIGFLRFIINNSILRKTAAYFLIKAVPALRQLHENVERYTKKELSTSIERDLPLDLNKN